MKLWVSLAACCALASGCGAKTQPVRLPYSPNETAIIGGLDNPDGLAPSRVVETPDAEGCIELDGPCVKPQDECGDDGAADVLLDQQGAIADVICYPTAGVSIEEFEGDVEHVGNDVVLVLDDDADGVDVEGDVTIDGNNVTLYGAGPDVSVIGGDLAIDKNNTLVRGVRIAGDVTIDKNNPSIVDCVIEGSLTIRGNNVSVALCEVWGELTIEGNNAILVNNRFAKPPVITGNNTVCNQDLLFSDVNDDGAIGDAELGEPISCAAKAE